MKGKAIIPLVLGLFIGLLAVKFVIDTVRKAQAGQTRATVSVVRAKQDIGAYLEIEADMIEVVETADTQLVPPSDRVEKLEDAVKRVTAKSIPAKSPVLLSMLAPKGARPGMVARIPTGYRAVSVKIDEVTGVAYQIKPGDWVDVNVVMDMNTGGRKKETISEVILQKVQVAAMGQGGQSESSDMGKKVKPAKSATLLVKEEEVPKLHLAATRGKITLSLRGEQDSEITEKLPKAGDKDLLKALGLADDEAANKTPTLGATTEPSERDTHEVIVVRGSGNLERMTFEGPDSFNLIGVSRSAAPPPSQNPLEQAIRRPPNREPAPAGAEPAGLMPPPEGLRDVEINEDQDYALPRE